MSRPRGRWLAPGLLVLGSAVLPALARDLVFEDRVHAQEAIERVYYSHQFGATTPFDQAVPRQVLEQKVRTYLKQTLALQQLWNTPVTADMLRAELERMVQASRMPGRLRELFEALGNDSFLVRECLARQVLVERLTRNFFAFDERIHEATRLEADRVRRDLLDGIVDPLREHPTRQVDEGDSERPIPERGLGSHSGIEAAREDREHARAAPVRSAGGKRVQIGPVVEERAHFRLDVVAKDRAGSETRTVIYSFAKRPWNEWWEEIAPGFDERDVEVVVPESAVSTTDELARFASFCEPDDTWHPVSWAGPTQPRASHVAVWTGSVMIVWGGYAFPTTRLASGARYDPATDTWKPTSVIGAPSPRISHTAVWTGHRMIVWGGYGQALYGDGASYDPVADTWTPISTVDAPVPRCEHAALWTGSRMIVWGGTTCVGPVVYLDSGGVYDPAADRWSATAAVSAPEARTRHRAVWTGDAMVVWGGYKPPATPGTGDVPLNTGGRYDPVTDTWTTVSTVGAPVARWGHASVWTGTHMVVWGGRDVTYSDLRTGGRYDPTANTWTSLSVAGAPTGRIGHTAVWTGDTMIVWGGCDRQSACFDSGGRYDPVRDVWTATSTTGAPYGRRSHTAVWTGNLMIVWGGSEVLPGGGGRYDPTTDSWTPTSIDDGRPEPRYSHTAVWTGNHMIVWGGADRVNQRINTGGRYEAATDTWKPMSTLGAPSPRTDHTAIWTGSQMIVWGGWDGTLVGTGASYDPPTDSWKTISNLGSPPRSNHAAVWTGSAMIVWGGAVGAGGVSGVRYDPATDQWAPISTVNAPSNRANLTAVWTGSRMIVWGGGSTNTGGRYDPASDTWTSTSTSWVPTPRSHHKAVWTGSRMVVWGGLSPVGEYLATGGRYDPDTDSWYPPMNGNGAPSARVSHTAVWASNRMIVWGGYTDGLSLLADGGRYDPRLNRWEVPVSTQGAPMARSFHTTVWTGDSMIVWGGWGDFPYAGPRETGGRYAWGHGTDDDGDGLSECDGDCDDADPTVRAVPTEVADVRFAADKVTLSWRPATNAGSASVHDVARGALDELPVGAGASEVCQASGIAAASSIDATAPSPSAGFWYLARARNRCGTGTYGRRGDGVERTTGVCP